MMLEVKNLSKEYKVPNGPNIKALDDVSLKFPETGLVFILGKSGSGKSTLLNAMGGLDKVDSGEIIINNKSSKDFNSSEMDSYRNTYLGFIFQEYNILNDFTVKENIALALQLQHKKADEKTISDILEEVDLKGMEKRKPNQISGGQKQRVAIARALVKNPQIIFGDEPTGALDSNTGKMVFDTLKKLSKTRLVVIVTHDRDFAEKFGDRVIELKDGKVISDITKVESEIKEINPGLSVISNGLIKIDKGHKLTESDIDAINKELNNDESPAFISSDARVNSAISEAAMIDSDGNVQSFEDTIQDEVKVGEGEFEVIKSKFPFKSALKMGARSLRLKPVRLIITILLSVVAFTLFGLSATLAQVNKTNLTTNSIVDAKVEDLYMYRRTVSFASLFSSEEVNPVKSISKTEFENVCNKIGTSFDPTIVYNKETGSNYQRESLSCFSKNITDDNRYYTTTINGLMEGSSAVLEKYGAALESGVYPKTTSEICISLDLYNSFKERGYVYQGTTVSPENVSYETIIGKTIPYGNDAFKISGIVDTKINLDAYSGLKNAKYNQNEASKLAEYRNTTIHGMAFVSSELFNIADASTLAYGAFIAPMPTSLTARFDIEKVVKFYYDSLDEYGKSSELESSYFYLDNIVTSNVGGFINLVPELAKVFLYIGIGFAVFAVLLFFNYVSLSIANKRREIGILRAVGARGIDVFKIFFSEAGIISLINFLISIILVFIISGLINNGFATLLPIRIAIFAPGIITILLVFGISLVAGLISSLLPVIRIASQKPIDAIREK